MRNPFQLSEDKMLRLGTCLVGLTVLFTVAVLLTQLMSNSSLLRGMSELTFQISSRQMNGAVKW